MTVQSLVGPNERPSELSPRDTIATQSGDAVTQSHHTRGTHPSTSAAIQQRLMLRGLPVQSLVGPGERPSELSPRDTVATQSGDAATQCA